MEILLTIILVVSVVVGGFILLGVSFDEYVNKKDKVRDTIIGLLLLGVAIACVLLLSHVTKMLDKQPWKREAPYVVHTVMALNDGNEINGSFRGGRRYGMSGYINEEFMYVYGYKLSNGGMKIQKVSEKNATVFFDNSVVPNAKWYKETKSYWWREETRYTCDIFIPEDSLQAEMVIDLQ